LARGKRGNRVPVSVTTASGKTETVFLLREEKELMTCPAGEKAEKLKGRKKRDLLNFQVKTVNITSSRKSRIHRKTRVKGKRAGQRGKEKNVKVGQEIETSSVALRGRMLLSSSTTTETHVVRKITFLPCRGKPFYIRSDAPAEKRELSLGPGS